MSTPAGPLLRSASSWDLRGGSLEVREWPCGRTPPIRLGTDLVPGRLPLPFLLYTVSEGSDIGSDVMKQKSLLSLIHI